MADPQGEGTATVTEPTQDIDADLTDDQRNAVDQAEKPDEVREIISAASKRARQAENELKAARTELQGLQERDKSELEKATSRAERAEARLAEMEQTVTRSAVAARYGIPTEHALRLRGDTEEELEADAKEFAKSFAKQETEEESQLDLGGGARSSSATEPGSKGFSDTLRRQAQRRR